MSPPFAFDPWLWASAAAHMPRWTVRFAWSSPPRNPVRVVTPMSKGSEAYQRRYAVAPAASPTRAPRTAPRPTSSRVTSGLRPYTTSTARRSSSFQSGAGPRPGPSEVVTYPSMTGCTGSFLRPLI
jgi:hypothetical protein